jgi:hypothetical protein
LARVTDLRPEHLSVPALTSSGPGLWNFGFFDVGNGLPENMVRAVRRCGCTPVTCGIRRTLSQLRLVPGVPAWHKDDAVDQRTKLIMRQCATHVTGMVIKNSGHWIYEGTRLR